MKRPSLTVIVAGLFVAYLGHSMWTLFSLFNPEPCVDKTGKYCIHSLLRKSPDLDLAVMVSEKQKGATKKDLFSVLSVSKLNVSEVQRHTVNVTIPSSTKKNGSLFVHVFVHPHKKSIFSEKAVHSTASLTTYIIPKSETINLMGEDKSIKPKVTSKVSHWHSQVTITVMTDTISFDRRQVPQELMRYLKITTGLEYQPILHIDELSNRIKDLHLINSTVEELPLIINYRPISVGMLRMWISMQESIKMLHGLGFTEKDTDEVKGIFTDIDFYFLMLTFLVAAFHLLFDFLAFKNDVTYWKNREDMVGLSTKTVVWRCISTFIIFLYLLDEETSLLVLIPAGIGTIIELWKVRKALKVQLVWTERLPAIKFGVASDKEQETENIDSEAMKYLSYVIWPICLIGAVYSLLYVPHKSWYSWCINSLVNGIYGFGFLFMLPQLFLNYKLKSVAHLPWRAFMYKAFNTFIDDIFAFIITMPTAHRVACFRDDIVFLIYLYQRWLYPVDKSRANEYGQTFEDSDKKLN